MACDAREPLHRRRRLGIRRVLGVAWAVVPLVQGTAKAQAPHVEHYTVEAGLGENGLRSVVQDQAGFIWIGGRRGLQRFDGRDFVSIRELNPSAPAALGELVGFLRRGPQGTLWMWANGALYRLEPSTGAVTPVHMSGSASDGGSWAVDSSGTVWVATQDGLFRVDSTGTRVQHVRGTSGLTRVRAVASAATGDVWMVHDDGISSHVTHVRPATGEQWVHALPRMPEPRSVFVDAGGRVWVGGDSGVAVLLPGATAFVPVPGTRQDNVMQVLSPDGRGVWALSDRELVRMDTTGAIAEVYNAPGLFGAGYLPQEAAFDREAGLWLATLTAGLFHVDPRTTAFHFGSDRSEPPLPLGSHFVTALAESRTGDLWVSTLRGGAYHLRSDGTLIEAVRHRADGAGLPSDEVWDVSVDSSGAAWLATVGGLCSAGNGSLHCYGPSTGVVDLEPDPDGWLWVASDGRVSSFDRRHHRFHTSVETGSDLTSVFVDVRTGLLWVFGTRVAYAHMANGALTTALQNAPSLGATVYQGYRDSGGVLWLATDRGLWRWENAPSGQPAPVSLPALRDAIVFSIVGDARGSVWLGTSRGIVHYAPSTGTAERFGVRDGVLSGEFTRRAALRRHDGSLWLGGVEGITWFHPDRVHTTSEAPAVAFTGVQRVTDRGIQTTPATGLLSLQLDRHDRAVTIAFAALTYAATASPRYRFRLVGSRETGWTETRERSVTFSALPPGHYQLHVQATVSEHDWGEPGALATLDVTPPFWRTLWFELVIAGFAAILLFSLHRARLSRAIATERLRLQISRDLHDELGAGLSSIALLSDVVGRDDGLAPAARTQLQRIGAAARRMVGDMRDIVWSIDPAADRLDDLLRRMRDLASDLLPGIHVDFRVTPEAATVERISMQARRDLFLLYKELLTNIARHAHASTVTVRVTADGGAVVLSVQDDGCGFAVGAVEEHTGFRSMRERAARLGGTLEMGSAPGTGTTARLSLRKTRMRHTPSAPTA